MLCSVSIFEAPPKGWQTTSLANQVRRSLVGGRSWWFIFSEQLNSECKQRAGNGLALLPPANRQHIGV